LLRQSEIRIRSCSESDLDEIIKLYKFQNLRYAYLDRDRDFIKYYFKHPDVRADSAFVSVKDSQITGFAIIAVTVEEDVKYGNVIEFQAIDSQSADKLLQKIEEYCNKEDVDAIMIVPPPHLQKAVSLKRWVSFSPNILLSKCVSPSNLLKFLFTCNNKLKKRVREKSVVLRIDGVAYEIKSVGDSIEIMRLRETAKNKLVIDLSSQDLTKMVFGRLNIINIMLGIITRKIRVSSIRNIGFLTKLLNDLKITDAVYISLGDLV